MENDTRETDLLSRIETLERQMTRIQQEIMEDYLWFGPDGLVVYVNEPYNPCGITKLRTKDALMYLLRKLKSRLNVKPAVPRRIEFL